MNSFHEVRFPQDVSFGATGGPERRNEIVLMTSGREKRNLRFAHSHRRYDAGTGVRSLDDLAAIVDFFEARRGSYHGFRFRDPFDMKSCAVSATPGHGDQPIGTGNGVETQFQLSKTYGVGAEAYRRPIRKPLAGSILVAVGGAAKASPADFTVDVTTGLVTFAPGSVPANGAAVTAGFEFDVPVRFDTERLEVSMSGFRAGQIPTIPIVEIEP